MSPLERQDLLTPGGWCPRGLLAALQGAGRPSSRSWPPTGTAPRPRDPGLVCGGLTSVPDAQRGLRRPHPGMIGPTLGRVCALCLPARRCTTLLPSRGRLGRGPRGLVPAGRFLTGCCGTTSPPSHGDRGHRGPRGTHLPALSSVKSTALDSVSLRVKPLWSRGCASSRTDKSRFLPV